MAGPQEQRLIQSLGGVRPENVEARALEWYNAAGALREVAQRLAVAELPVPDGDAGAQTAAAMDAAFKKSAQAMGERAAKLDDGHAALIAAAKVISDAQQAHTTLGAEESAPTYTPHPDPGSEAGIKAKNQFNDKMATYQAGVDHRESVSRKHADDMDKVLQASSRTMKEIHGEPDPPPPPQGRGDNPGAQSGGGKTPGNVSHSVTGVGYHASSGTITDPGGPKGSGPLTGHVTPTSHGTLTEPSAAIPGSSGGQPGSGTGSGSTIPGVTPIGASSGGGGLTSGTGVGVAGVAAGGVGGGLLSGGLLSGLRGGGVSGVSGVSGGVTPVTGTAATGTAQSAVRGIGTTARAPGASTIGRSGSVTAGSAGTTSARGTAAGSSAGRSAGAGSRAGASGAGRAAGRAGAGGRSSAGRAGAGAGAGGRNGRGKDDEKGRKRDLFDVAEDWIDDEEAAPGVLG